MPLTTAILWAPEHFLSQPHFVSSPHKLSKASGSKMQSQQEQGCLFFGAWQRLKVECVLNPDCAFGSSPKHQEPAKRPVVVEWHGTLYREA